MCTLYNIKASRAEVAALFDAVAGNAPAELEIPEIYPNRRAFVVRATTHGRVVDAMAWGFPPPATLKAPVVNARNLASPFWRSSIANPAQRCLVPVSSFSEWETTSAGKVKRWFNVPTRPVFAFAGLWRPTDTGAVFAFLTCAPNPLVGAIHPKAMPVILDDEDHETWLTGDTAAASALAVPFPSQLMAMG